MKAIKKMEIKKVLSCFAVFVILMSVVLIFVTQSNAVMPVDIYMGKVTEKNNNILTVQIEYKPDYSNWPPKWVSYSATSQWTISNSNAINEIRVGDYIEIAGFLGVDNEGESVCIGKMKSSTEKVITDVYGDLDYLLPNPQLLGNYIIEYENTPDCSKYQGIGISGCNVEAKYSDVSIRKEDRQLKSQRLYPSQNYGYEDEEYKVDITFNSGEAPAYPDCTDQPCFGPQAFSDFTIHIKKKAEGKPDLIIDDIYWSPANPKVGDSVVITAVAKNIGSASSERCEGVIRVFDEHMPSLYFYIPELAPNEKYEESMNWKAEECGEYSVEARADYDKEIDESNEWNNRLEEMINIPCKKRPDLTVEEVRWEPENPSIGDSITFTIKVKNQGDGDAGECEAWSSIVVGSDVSICDFIFTVPSLTASEEFTYTNSCKATKCGEFYVLVGVDFWDAVKESNEDNNHIEEPISISCIEKKPDLIIQDISWNPSNPDKGDTVTFYVDIKNQGSGSAGAFYVYYYIDDSYVDHDYVSLLSAGSTSAQTFTWTANKCGDVQVKAIADATNAVDEGSNEGNNVRTETVNIVCPMISILQVPYESVGGAAWCLPASTAMVLKYYGKNVHVWDIADSIDLKHDEGTTMNKISNYLKEEHPDLSGELINWNLKFQLNQFKDYLLSELSDDRNPVILSLPLSTDKRHAVTLVGVTEKDSSDPTFYINDPSDELFFALEGHKPTPHMKHPVAWSELIQFKKYGGYLTLSVEGTPNPSAGSFTQISCNIFKVREGEIEIPSYAFIWYDDGLKWNVSGEEHPLDYSVTVSSTDYIASNPWIENPMDSPKEYTFKLVAESGKIIYEQKISPMKDVQGILFKKTINELRLKEGENALYMELYDSSNKPLDRIGPIRFNVASISIEGRSNGCEDYEPLDVFFRGSKIPVKLQNLDKHEYMFVGERWEDKNRNLILEADEFEEVSDLSKTTNEDEFTMEILENMGIGLYRLKIRGTDHVSNYFWVIFNATDRGLSEEDIQNYWKSEKTGIWSSNVLGIMHKKKQM